MYNFMLIKIGIKPSQMSLCLYIPSSFQENSTTCPAITAPPSSGLSTDGAIAIGVTLGLLGVVVAVAIIVVVVLVVMHKRRGVGRSS